MTAPSSFATPSSSPAKPRARPAPRTVHGPLAVTPFQRRVYAVVKRIPRGEVRSYQWVARQLGDPTLARAVGQALHRNPCPIRVPCHRVVRADGSLGGYAWGPAKKRRLLAQERLMRYS